jgi:hypothetical protein
VENFYNLIFHKHTTQRIVELIIMLFTSKTHESSKLTTLDVKNKMDEKFYSNENSIKENLKFFLFCVMNVI